MKQSNEIVQTRHQYIFNRLLESNTMSVSDLAEELAVTPITIRRDLQAMAEQGLISRFHGGVSLVKGAVLDAEAPTGGKDPYDKEREAIAKYAASLVEDKEIIFLNSSTTALRILKYLEGKNVTVITNNGRALSTKVSSGIEVVLTGGEIYKPKQSLVGDFAVQALTRVMANKAFLGVSGISAAHGLTTSILQETAVNDMMMRRCGGHCYILADHSKVGQENNFLSAPIARAQMLITDSASNAKELERIRAQGVEVVTVSG